MKNRAIALTISCIMVVVIISGFFYLQHRQYLRNEAIAQAAWRQSIPGMLDWVQHHPDDADMHYKLAIAEMVHNTDRTEAIGQARDVLQLEPNNRRAKYLLAILLKQDGQVSAANTIFSYLARTNDSIGKKAAARLVSGNT